MGYQTDLLPALRDWGLNVKEVNGWQTRGSSTFNPRGSVNHHTAGSRYNSLPSLNILVNGHGTLPGPLCNVAQSRSTQYNSNQKLDDVYLIAAGRANHAGYGGWAGLSGNSSVFGLEIEHVGYLDREPFGERRQETAYRVHRAFMDAGGFGADKVCQHKEWAPTRKIDFVGANGNNFRTSVANMSTASSEQPVTPVIPLVKEEDNIMQLPAKIVKASDSPHWWVTDGITRQHVPNRTYAGILINQGIANAAKGTGDLSKTSEIVPWDWPGDAVNAIRLVGDKP